MCNNKLLYGYFTEVLHTFYTYTQTYTYLEYLTHMGGSLPMTICSAEFLTRKSQSVSIFRETKHANTKNISHVIITQGS